MATLSKRAGKAEKFLLRIIEGAIKDAINAHPAWVTDTRLSSSIAKRAVGTLMAERSKVLALLSGKAEASE